MNSQTWHAEATSADHPENGTRFILSVDDEAAILYTRQAILKDAGYQVLNASDGKQALHLFGLYSACIDLVLLDYRMPESDGGIVAQEMKRCKPGVPIILVCASAIPQQILTCFDSRIDKGEGPAVLLERVGQLLTACFGCKLPPSGTTHS